MEDPMDKSIRNLLINFFSVTILSFLLIFFGLKIAAGSQLSMQNAILLLGFCMLLGLISSVFYKFKMKAAWIIFNLGVAVGLIDMFYVLFSNLSGWEDLAALASLFIWIVIGLGAGLVVQFILLLIQRSKNKK
jgi:hypothetical protein